MQITSLPSDVVQSIFQQTDWYAPLKYVCKGFFSDFFHAFLRSCGDSDLLRNRVNQIQQSHSHLSSQEKIKALYNSFLEEIQSIECDTDSPEKLSQNDMLKLKCSSIERLHQLEKWLEDTNLINFCEGLAKEIHDVHAHLITIKYKDTNEKAISIRKWLYSQQKNLVKFQYMRNLFGKSFNKIDLNRLPKEIKLLTQLTSIHLETCSFLSLPEEIVELKQLTEICLCGNRFSYWPKKIEELKRLSKFIFAYNGFSNLPKEIGDLRQLEYLDLSGNQLSSLPKEISNLKQLKDLKFDDNNFLSWPEEISGFNCLTQLSFCNNKLSSVPKEIGNLRQLESLDLSGNQLSSLPNEIGNLSQLQRLDLTCNQLSSLPNEMGNLNQLTRLYLQYNQLSNLPAEIANLSQLQQLTLSHNQFTSLPKEIGGLNLYWFQFENNPLHLLDKVDWLFKSWWRKN